MIKRRKIRQPRMPSFIQGFDALLQATRYSVVKQSKCFFWRKVGFGKWYDMATRKFYLVEHDSPVLYREMINTISELSSIYSPK